MAKYYPAYNNSRVKLTFEEEVSYYAHGYESGCSFIIMKASPSDSN
jgi:hypothetical protein